MQRSLDEAKRGEGKVSPNPLVGAVITDEDGNITATGFHEKYGGPHAEVNAINKAKGKTKDATLFVNLEPCSHHGLTPPCTDLIIQSGFKRVVIGMTDPNPKVNGEGIKKLKAAGIEVITGVLEDECKKLNEIFIKNKTKGQPFIAIKTATTLDGKIASSCGSSKWITSESARAEVHRLRNKYDAILTSHKTIALDNPSMTCRLPDGRNPVRVVVDTNFKSDLNSKFFEDNGAKIYVAVDESHPFFENGKWKMENGKLEQNNRSSTPLTNEENRTLSGSSLLTPHFIKCPIKNGHVNLKYLVQKLFEKGIMSILIEAGGELNGAFINAKLADKLYHFIAPKIAGDSAALSWVSGFSIKEISECTNLKIENTTVFAPDILVEAYFTQNQGKLSLS